MPCPNRSRPVRIVPIAFPITPKARLAGLGRRKPRDRPHESPPFPRKRESISIEALGFPLSPRFRGNDGLKETIHPSFSPQSGLRLQPGRCNRIEPFAVTGDPAADFRRLGELVAATPRTALPHLGGRFPPCRLPEPARLRRRSGVPCPSHLPGDPRPRSQDRSRGGEPRWTCKSGCKSGLTILCSFV